MIAPALVYDAATGRIAMPSASAWAGVAYLGVLPTLVAMLLFAFAIRNVGPVQAGLSTHLVPSSRRSSPCCSSTSGCTRSTRRASRSSPAARSSAACAPRSR
jgi:hypothetical protein